MAYPVSDSYFKKQYRGARTQSVDEMFNMGMQFSNAPLQQGACKLSVNLDTKDRGDTLIPRPAIQTVHVSGHLSTKTNSILVDGKTSAEPTATYEQVLLGSVTDTKETDADSYIGSITPLTIVPTEEFYLSQLVGTAVNTTYNKPTSASVHGIKVSDTSTMASNVGSFGFNNSYYCFNATTNKLMQSKFITDRYQFQDLTPKMLTPKEAVSWGYNMLQDNAYLFDDTVYAGTVQLLGLLPYKADGALALNAKVNETVTLRCYYAGPANSYKVVWEWKELNGSDWTKIKEQTVDLTALPEIKTDFSFPAERLMIRTTFTKGAETSPEQVLTVSFDLTTDESSSTNLKPDNYDLHTASGMTYWKNRLIVYGVPKDRTILFTSDINDPTYFPYPNGAEVFDEPVIHVLPFLEKLLVFTTTKLYMLTLAEDGSTWNVKHIQSNLDIKEWDIHLIQQVKNMVFFKSGNYFYMVVPSNKMNTLGELVVTNVSKSIEQLFDSFKENIDNTVKLIYDYDRGLELVHYYNFLDYEDIHNIYAFKTVSGVYLNVALLYNTMSRTWRFHMFESADLVKSYKPDVTKKGTLVSILNGGVQLLQFNGGSAKDNYIDSDYVVKYPQFKNYQLLDTGYRNIDTDYNKRFREFQIKFNNISQRTLTFSTDFYIDGELRQDMYNYKVTHSTDPLDPQYLNIVVEKDLIPRISLPGTTMLAENETDVGYWQLDVSGFPEMFLWKARVPVSGKGLSPRMRFVSYNEELFEVLNIAWVIRKLYSR